MTDGRPQLRVESADGTVIDVKTAGQGPPLVLVHGALLDRRCWSFVLPLLAEQYTVHLFDRRGRRHTADGHAPYDIAREGEDVAAVAAAAGRDVYVVGHSYGSLCSLEAALITDVIGRLALYDPPVPTPGYPLAPPGAADRLAALAAAGDWAGVAEAFMRETLDMPAADVAAMKGSRIWDAAVGNAPPIARELGCVAQFSISGRLSQIAIPVRCFLGAQSPPYHRAAIDALTGVLPDADVVTLDGQGHMAIMQAPAQFAAAVSAFGRDAGHTWPG